MNDLNCIELSYLETKELKDIFIPKVFSQSTDIIYYNHVPMASYALIKGCFHLKDKKNRIIKSFSPNTLLGFHEHAMRRKFNYYLEVSAGSLVSIIHAEVIKEIVQKNPILKEKFSQVLPTAII